jgi:hypothetical protein
VSATSSIRAECGLHSVVWLFWGNFSALPWWYSSLRRSSRSLSRPLIWGCSRGLPSAPLPTIRPLVDSG